MKRMYLILSVAILLVVSSTISAYATDNGLQLGEVELLYSYFDGRPVTIVIDFNSGRAIMRIPISYNDISGEAELEYMTSAVLALVSSKEGVNIGSSGFTIHFTGGYPIWGPHSSCTGPESWYKCLQFAEGGNIYGKHITINGSSKPPFSWYYDKH